MNSKSRAAFFRRLDDHGCLSLVTGFLTIAEGFICGGGAGASAGWRAAGKLKSREDVVAGLQTFPETLLKLFTGENFGKLVLKVADN